MKRSVPKSKFRRRLRLVIRLAAILLGAVLISAGLINIMMTATGSSKIYKSTDSISFEGADCILVLGAGVREDGSPSHMLEDRLKTAVAIYNTGICSTLLMSGDHGQVEYDEVSAMRDYVLDNGIPAENVFLDHAGFSTYDSIYRARDVFGAKKIIIVSQRYHLYRALYLAQSLGLEAVGVDAELRTYVGQAWRDTREVIARAKDFAYGVFKPKPTYLGEQIDLSGDGRITWDN